MRSLEEFQNCGMDMDEDVEVPWMVLVGDDYCQVRVLESELEKQDMEKLLALEMEQEKE